MKQHLETLRAKPEHIKRRIAFFSSLSISLLILFVWVVSFQIQSSAEVAQANNDDSSIKTPAVTLSANVSDAWDSLKEVISGAFKGSKNSATNNSLEVVPGNR